MAKIDRTILKTYFETGSWRRWGKRTSAANSGCNRPLPVPVGNRRSKMVEGPFFCQVSLPGARACNDHAPPWWQLRKQRGLNSAADTIHAHAPGPLPTVHDWQKTAIGGFNDGWQQFASLERQYRLPSRWGGNNHSRKPDLVLNIWVDPEANLRRLFVGLVWRFVSSRTSVESAWFHFLRGHFF